MLSRSAFASSHATASRSGASQARADRHPAPREGFPSQGFRTLRRVPKLAQLCARNPCQGKARVPQAAVQA